jgi:hypothetical protein
MPEDWISEDDPLWFLKHNPRAHGEVKDWLEQKKPQLWKIFIERGFEEMYKELLSDLTDEAKTATGAKDQ